MSESSLDSAKLRGDDDSYEEDGVKSAANLSGIKLNRVGSGVTDNTPQKRETKSVAIKTAKISVQEDIGLLSRRDINEISTAVEALEGVIDCEVNTTVLPNIVKVSFRANGTPLRNIIAEV